MKAWIARNKWVLLLFCIIFITRLPQLFSSNMVLDGDECIVGLMAKHFDERKELPLFFYGQSYGFSFIEVATVAAGYKLAGISDFTVKLSMLVLWAFGVLFFYRSILSICNGKKLFAFCVTLILILSPAWAVWSMKARGGYISSFLLSNLVLYALLCRKYLKQWQWFTVGIFCVFIYQCQPLWLPGLLPFICAAIVTNFRGRNLFAFTSGIVITCIGFYFLKHGLNEYWKPEVKNNISATFRFASIPENIFHHFTGYYFLNMKFPASAAATLFAFVFITIAAASFFIGIYRVVKNRTTNPWLLPALFSVAVTGSYLIVIDITQLRYLLPASAYMLILMACIASQHGRAVINLIVYGILVVTGCVSLYCFKDYRFEQEKRSDIIALIQHLEKENITHVFFKDSQMQWKVSFYSCEKIIARYVYPADRYSPYIERVNTALITTPHHTAIVSLQPIDPLKDKHAEIVAHHFFIYRDINSAVVARAGFQL